MQFLAVGQNEVTACKLLYPSHFLTPEDAHAQQIAAQQQVLAVMVAGFLICSKYHTSPKFNKGPQKEHRKQIGDLEVQVGIRAIDQAEREQGNEDLANGSDSEGAPALLA